MGVDVTLTGRHLRERGRAPASLTHRVVTPLREVLYPRRRRVVSVGETTMGMAGEERQVSIPAAEAEETLRSRALAAMFAAGAVLALVTLALPGGGTVNTAPWALNASVGLPVAVVLWVWGHRFPDLALHGCLVTGAAMVALGMTFGNGGSLTVAASFFFIWVALYSFLFFERGAAVAHLVLDAFLLSAALVWSGADAAPGVALLVTGTSVVVGAVTGATRAQLARAAITDQLTGLPNRHALHDALMAETARSARSHDAYSVIIIDLDEFKAVNDTDGHHAGDLLLASSARAWRECLRPTDVMVRYGGDEFVAVLPGCDPQQASIIAERLRSAATTRCSIGSATWRLGDDEHAVLRRADQHLYASKRGGGNRVTADGEAGLAVPTALPSCSAG